MIKLIEILNLSPNKMVKVKKTGTREVGFESIDFPGVYADEYHSVFVFYFGRANRDDFNNFKKYLEQKNINFEQNTYDDDNIEYKQLAVDKQNVIIIK